MAWLKSASNHCMPGMSGCLMAEDVNAWPKSLPNEIQSALRRTRVQASLKGCTRERFLFHCLDLEIYIIQKRPYPSYITSHIDQHSHKGLHHVSF